MDEADEYVPQISQMDPAEHFGMPLASDLSADNYVPPPPGPSGFGGGGGGGDMLMPPTTPYQQPPPAGLRAFQQPPQPPAAKSKGKKKRATTAAQEPSIAEQQAFMSAGQQQTPGVPGQPGQMPPGYWGYQQQQQHPAYGGQGYQQHYGPAGFQQQQQMAYYRQQAPMAFYQQQQQQRPMYGQYGQQQGYYQQQQPQFGRYPQPNSNYQHQAYMQNQQQQQLRMQQAQQYQQQQQPSYGYTQQQSQLMLQQQQQAQQAQLYASQQQQAASNYQQQQQQAPLSQETQPQGQVTIQRQPNNASVQWARQGMDAGAQAQMAAQYQQQPQQQPGMMHNQELRYLQEQMHNLAQQPQTPMVKQQMGELHQRMAFIRNQQSTMMQQQQQQQQSDAQYSPTRTASSQPQQNQPPFSVQVSTSERAQVQTSMAGGLAGMQPGVSQSMPAASLQSAAMGAEDPSQTPPPPPPGPPNAESSNIASNMAQQAQSQQLIPPISALNQPPPQQRPMAPMGPQAYSLGASSGPMGQALRPHAAIGPQVVQPPHAVSSMALMLPQQHSEHHKGAAVEVKIKPYPQSTTMISIHQYPEAREAENEVPQEPLPPSKQRSPTIAAPPPRPTMPLPAAPPVMHMPPQQVPVPAPVALGLMSKPARCASPPPPVFIGAPPSTDDSAPTVGSNSSDTTIDCLLSSPVTAEPAAVEEAPHQPKSMSEVAATHVEVSPAPKAVLEPEPLAVQVPQMLPEVCAPAPPVYFATTPLPDDDSAKDSDAEKLPPKKKSKKKATAPKESKARKPRYPNPKKKGGQKRKRQSFESDESADEAAAAATAERSAAAPPTADDAAAAPTAFEVAATAAIVNSAVIDEIPDDLLEKRRSGRVTKRKRYNNDENWEIDLSDEDLKMGKKGKSHDSQSSETDQHSQNLDVDTMVVEKILLVRPRQDASASEDAARLDEYYVKFKGFSYLHCDWKTEKELELGDKRVGAKVKRFRQRREHATTFLDEQYDEDEPFNPDYIQVERVLDVSTESVAADANENSSLMQVDCSTLDTSKGEMDTAEKGESTVAEVGVGPADEDATTATEEVTHYLIKWRSLQYEECTWELEKNVDKDKIQQFFGRKDLTEQKLIDVPRPTLGMWRKQETNPVFKGGNQLREYQLEGLDWLLFCWYKKQNCILADEMGLGKTIQTISFLVKVQECGMRGPFIVIAPLSTIHNWQREFETWSNINAIVYHGTSASRRMIQEYEFYFRDENGERIPSPHRFDVLITTYEMILADCEELKEIHWKIAVIDEAHRLKNRNCKLLAGFSQMQMDHRVLLTGTPLQNNVDELFSLLNFLEPRQFASSTAFLDDFGSCQTDEQVSKLQDILKPMMLRRLKEDVEKTLKPKEETIIEVELTNTQKKYYRAILEKNFSHLCKGASVPSLMNTMMELRKCCNHPFLITGAEEQILAETAATQAELSEEAQTHSALVHASGKLVLIDKLLPRLRQDGHKVLVFSQMVRCLDLLEEYLAYKKYTFERIDGNVRGDMRQAAIDRFCRPDSDRFVFLLCTRAGGLGINLTPADTVIIFDSDWNPQNDLQAQARCHRIGQEKSVKVYRLITRNTYEREMFDKASLKLGLDKAVLQSMGTKENLAAQLSKKEVEELLKKGAYGALMDDPAESADKFSEEDIDTILQRRTTTITLQPGVKGSTFAKASFNVSSNREDIDVNDPNFWQKWAKKANVNPNLNPEAELILYEPRQRKRRFNDEVYHISEESTSDSDEDSKNERKRLGRRRRGAEDSAYIPDELAFSKSDYFKVEKFLIIYGWGRWREILAACELKQQLSEDDIEHMCRTVLLHCLRQHAPDDKVRDFTWHLIRPPTADDDILHRASALRDPAKYQGLCSRATRGGGRRSSRLSTSARSEATAAADADDATLRQGWAALPVYNPPSLAVDYSYQRHLERHANRVLLRVRLLYFVEHEVIGEWAEKIAADIPSEKIDLDVAWHPELPVSWWDADADKSLLIGTYKHGFESFVAMREDPALCFLDRCGPADSAAVAADNDDDDDTNDETDSADKNSETLERPTAKKKVVKDESRSDYLPFPSASDLNARLRRLMTLFQRTSKMTVIREEQRAKRSARQEQIQAVLQERESRRLEERQRWTRREETDFYRTLISFGVETDALTGEQRWRRFRQLARLDAKFDQTLSDYYAAFVAMCKRLAKRPLSAADESLSYMPEALTEERANKVLQRVEFLSRVRATLRHPKLEERLGLCKRTPDLPVWWQPGVPHDLHLLKGVAKHGLSKSEELVAKDADLCFYDIWQQLQKENAALLHETRATTRATARLGASPNKDAYDDADDADLAISQILAQQSGNLLQWPKERMVVFRLQNVCLAVESGEWPSAALGRGAVELDHSTPDDTPHGTPLARSDADSPALYARATTPKAAAGRRGRRGGKAAAGASANPLHDLMEAEKERMRALVHQSFLQQLEQAQLPFAAAAALFPFALPAGLQSLGGSPSTSASASAAADQALNLSTKAKKDERKKADSKSTDSPAKAAQLGDVPAMGSLPAGDTRVPVISLKDGTRLTGKEAPTLGNLASWLAEHPNFIIDTLSTQMLPQAELEPGEIPRAKMAEAPKSEPSKSASEKVNVVNRKNGLRLPSAKCPSVTHLAMWLEKNPDWDVDASSAKLVRQKAKLPDKFKARVNSADAPPKTPSGCSSSAATPPAVGASAASSAGAMGDPFGGLLPGLGALDPATQLQLQMMALQSPFGNPALLMQPGAFGMGFPFGSLPGFMGGAGMGSPLTSPVAEKEQSSSSSSKKRESSSSKKKAESSRGDAAAAAAATENPFLAAFDAEAMGAANSSGIFGLNPFLAGGMMPGLNPSIAAMAQLQALMQSQGIESLMAAAGAQGMPMPPTSSSSGGGGGGGGSWSKRQSAGGDGAASSSRSSKSKSAKSSNKLDALVNKLAQAHKPEPSDTPPAVAPAEPHEAPAVKAEPPAAKEEEEAEPTE